MRVGLLAVLAAAELSACSRAPKCEMAGSFTNEQVLRRAVEVVKQRKASGVSTALSFDPQTLPKGCCEVRRLHDGGPLSPTDASATAATYAVELHWPDQAAFTKEREYIIYLDECLKELDTYSM